MSGRRTNIGLLLGLGVAFTTGIAAFGVGSGWNIYVTVTHGVAGFVLVLLAPWKSAIARRGLRRGRSGRTLSILLGTLVGAALLFGFLHSTGIALSIWGLTTMQLHVGAAVASLPLVVWHAIARPARVHRTDLERRALMRSGLVAAGAAASYAGLAGVEQIASLPGAQRRSTGSHERGTGHPEEMPVTQWLNDRVPLIEPATWKLKVGVRDWTYEEIAAFDTTVDALIDCTGGWFASQRWEGVSLSELLPDVGDARSIVVRSVTGYSRSYPIRDAPDLLLATRAAGRPLSAGHGSPARLVAPGRRGFWWVKWVDEIELSPRPWWLQSPFPLT